MAFQSEVVSNPADIIEKIGANRHSLGTLYGHIKNVFFYQGIAQLLDSLGIFKKNMDPLLEDQIRANIYGSIAQFEDFMLFGRAAKETTFKLEIEVRRIEKPAGVDSAIGELIEAYNKVISSFELMRLTIFNAMSVLKGMRSLVEKNMWAALIKERLDIELSNYLKNFLLARKGLDKAFEVLNERSARLKVA